MAARGVSDEHEVTPLELFFDLVLVFAFTQVTRLILEDPTWGGVFRGMLVLAALWTAWSGYAWLTSTMDVDEGGVRLALLASTAAMLGVALAVPDAFGDDALLFAAGFTAVRLLHLVLSRIVAADDADLREAIRHFAPTNVLAAILLVAAAFVPDDARIVLWLAALAVDYLGPTVLGVGRGWRVAPEHFAERHGLIVLIALGESIISIGAGAGLDLRASVLAGAALGMIVVSALWWLYFDVAAILARRRLMESTGAERARLARDAYTYLHFPMIAGIVLFAFGLETTLHHLDDELDLVAAAGLCAGTALYLLAQVGFMVRALGRIFRRRTIGAGILVAFVPAALALPALATLGIVAAVCSAIVAYEAIGHRAARSQVRHPEQT